MTVEALQAVLGERSLNLAISEAGEMFVSLAEAHEHWVMVFDSAGAEAIKEILERHYSIEKAEPGDCFAILSPSAGGENFFGVIALGKRRMLAPKLRWILQKAGVPMTEREIFTPHVMIIAASDQIPAVADFGEAVFGDKFRDWAPTGIFTREGKTF